MAKPTQVIPQRFGNDQPPAARLSFATHSDSFNFAIVPETV
jgi:hypothetical protein